MCSNKCSNWIARFTCTVPLSAVSSVIFNNSESEWSEASSICWSGNKMHYLSQLIKNIQTSSWTKYCYKYSIYICYKVDARLNLYKYTVLYELSLLYHFHPQPQGMTKQLFHVHFSHLKTLNTEEKPWIMMRIESIWISIIYNYIKLVNAHIFTIYSTLKFK